MSDLPEAEGLRNQAATEPICVARLKKKDDSSVMIRPSIARWETAAARC